MKPEDFAKLTKYDVTGVGVLIVEKDEQLFVGAPPLAGSTAAVTYIYIHTHTHIHTYIHTYIHIRTEKQRWLYACQVRLHFLSECCALAIDQRPHPVMEAWTYISCVCILLLL